MSAGAACHSGDDAVKVSRVLRAMGVETSVAVGTVRISFGRHTSMDDAEAGCDLIVAAANTLLGKRLKAQLRSIGKEIGAAKAAKKAGEEGAETRLKELTSKVAEIREVLKSASGGG